jgi:hypothetical protein
MRILVCGGRTFGRIPDLLHCSREFYEARKAEYQFIHQTLNELAEKHSKEYNPDDNWLPFDIVIIEGGADGADRAASDWAICNYAKSETYDADWNRYGNAAGPIRNRRMLEEGRPNMVVAFPGSAGTANMISLAQRAGVPVLEIERS